MTPSSRLGGDFPGREPIPAPAAPPPAAPAPGRPGRARRRRLVLLVAALLASLAAYDVARPVERQLSARVLLAGIGTYQGTLSPHMPSVGVRCRFRPTCSHYAAACIRRHGTLRGSWLTARRILRCGPWTPAATEDPPP